MLTATTTANSAFQRCADQNVTASHEATEQHQRPDQVELLLERQRPVVLHEGGLVGGREVVDGVGRERPVLDVEGRREDLAQVLAEALTGAG